jgi:hypothetical protein
MVTSVSDAFLEMAEHLPAYFPEHADQLRRYVTSLSWWMGGDRRWYDVTPRYNMTVPEKSHEVAYLLKPVVLAAPVV